MAKAKRLKREGAKKIAVEPCAGDGCVVLGLFRGPVHNGFQMWLCWHHFHLWQIDEGKRAIVASLQEFLDSRVWARPVSRFDHGTDRDA